MLDNAGRDHPMFAFALQARARILAWMPHATGRMEGDCVPIHLPTLPVVYSCVLATAYIMANFL
jgi:hypothetical protein